MAWMSGMIGGYNADLALISTPMGYGKDGLPESAEKYLIYPRISHKHSDCIDGSRHILGHAHGMTMRRC